MAHPTGKEVVGFGGAFSLASFPNLRILVRKGHFFCSNVRISTFWWESGHFGNLIWGKSSVLATFCMNYSWHFYWPFLARPPYSCNLELEKWRKVVTFWRKKATFEKRVDMGKSRKKVRKVAKKMVKNNDFWGKIMPIFWPMRIMGRSGSFLAQNYISGKLRDRPH